jgi:hypothetical protein
MPDHSSDRLDAVLIADTETLGAIAKGAGVIPRDRVLALGHILTTQSHLRQHVTALRKRVLPVPLAAHMSS